MKSRYVVINACVFGAAYFNETHTVNCSPILIAIQKHEIMAVIPPLVYLEFLRIAARKMAGGGCTSGDEIDNIVEDFLKLPLLVVEDTEHERVAASAWKLQTEHSFQNWNAYYFGLAKEWKAGLASIDGHFIDQINKYNSRCSPPEQIAALDLRIKAFD